MNYIHDARLLIADDMLHPDLERLYLLLVLARGTNTTLANVHDAWAIWKDTHHPSHPSLIPFDELSYATQELDRPFMDAIHRAARTFEEMP